MPTLLAILGTLAGTIAVLAIVYASGGRVRPLFLALAALAVLVLAGATLVTVVRHDLREQIGAPPSSPRPTDSGL
jgi:hypothetical protein